MLSSPTSPMPQMDGLELLAEIRDRWPESRVVVHSSLLIVEGSTTRQAGGGICLPLQVAQHRSAPQNHSVRFFGRISWTFEIPTPEKLREGRGSYRRSPTRFHLKFTPHDDRMNP